MKVLKILLIIIVLVLVAGGVATWYLVGNLDRYVQDTVQKVGSDQLGTDVSLQSVAISLAEAQAKLAGLTVANPPGYSAAPAFQLGSINVDLDLKSIRQDVLVIEEIAIIDPLVNFELNEDRVSNLDVLSGNMASPGADQGGDGEAKRIIIDRLYFKGGSIRATAAIRPDDELVFEFPAITLTGLGRPNGATPDEIGAEVTAILLERSMSAAKRAGVQQLVEVQTERLKEKAGEKLEEKLKDLLKRD